MEPQGAPGGEEAAREATAVAQVAQVERLAQPEPLAWLEALAWLARPEPLAWLEQQGLLAATAPHELSRSGRVAHDRCWRQLMELYLVTDHACNLSCGYCYAGPKPRRPMSVAVAERAIDLALGRDPSGLGLSFFGGEPLLAFELVEHTTTYAKRKATELAPEARVFVRLNTNGTLVDDRVQAFVQKHHPVMAFVSIDGPAQVHDRHRVDPAGHGSHSAVRLGIERLAAAGAEVHALAVVNPDTASLLGEVAEELFSLPVAQAVLTCNLYTAWNGAALDTLRDGLTAATGVWARAFRAGRCFRFEPFTTKILSHLHAAMPCAARCQLAGRDLAVAPSGRLYPCGELVRDDEDQRFAIGDVATGLSLDKLMALRDAKEQVESLCRDCAIRERCSSACGCKHVALTGTMGQITNTLCDIEAALIEAADQLAEALYAESCPAFLEFFYRRQWRADPGAALVRLRSKSPDPRGQRHA